MREDIVARALPAELVRPTGHQRGEPEQHNKGEDQGDLMRTSAGLEPALAAAERKGEALRRASQRVMVRNWLDRGVLRPELGAATTADILWAPTGPAMYQMLVKDRRWSKRRYRDWLHRSLSELLFRSSITR
jgi:hypothetical protein